MANLHNDFMIRVQRKYKVIKAISVKELEKEVNELIQREYKDTAVSYTHLRAHET